MGTFQGDLPDLTQAGRVPADGPEVYIETYGCQMNVYDSERMRDVLRPLGYAPVDGPEQADLVVLNTCHIREQATEKVYSELGQLKRMKEAYGGRKTIAVAGCVAQARRPEFYEDFAVPNTVDGRFDMITLMVGLVVHRLSKIEGDEALAATQLSQDLFATMFADMEINLREFGVSDDGMKHRIRDMAKAFMGRLNSYGPALDADDRLAALTEALSE